MCAWEIHIEKLSTYMDALHPPRAPKLQYVAWPYDIVLQVFHMILYSPHPLPKRIWLSARTKQLWASKTARGKHGVNTAQKSEHSWYEQWHGMHIQLHCYRYEEKADLFSSVPRCLGLRVYFIMSKPSNDVCLCCSPRSILHPGILYWLDDHNMLNKYA